MSATATLPIRTGPFDASWESLRTFACPDWFRDAKFGIWAHWGPQSVPMAGDWYARHLYVPGHPQYLHHWRTYGHPSQHGYKDLLPLWKAEQFDPEALLDRYKQAGARYFVAQAVHHDNFDNWDSKHHRWNSVKVGPHKDIVGLFAEATRKRGLRFGVTEHLGACFSWMRFNKHADPTGPYAGVPYDGNLKEYEDLYLPNQDEPKDAPWYTTNAWWHQRWFDRMKDLVDQYQPDLFYSDGGVPFDEVGRSLIAHLYNTSAAAHGANEAVYCQKDTKPEVYRVGVLDIERGQLNEIAAEPWQTDTTTGDWYYDRRYKYKTPSHVIEMLVDITSKNGCLLLNIPQLPDGSLDDESTWLCDVLAQWIAANGEGIYGTRPWKASGEGPTASQGGAFKENQTPWTAADFRFTVKGDTVYAFQMKDPETRQAAIRQLGRDGGRTVKAVRLLGYGGEVKWEQTERALVVRLPDQSHVPCVPCLAVELA